MGLKSVELTDSPDFFAELAPKANNMRSETPGVRRLQQFIIKFQAPSAVMFNARVDKERNGSSMMH